MNKVGQVCAHGCRRKEYEKSLKLHLPCVQRVGERMNDRYAPERILSWDCLEVKQDCSSIARERCLINCGQERAVQPEWHMEVHGEDNLGECGIE